MPNFGSSCANLVVLAVLLVPLNLLVVSCSALVVCEVDLTMFFWYFWLLLGSLLVHLDVFWWLWAMFW